jgi:hypothetical protein
MSDDSVGGGFAVNPRQTPMKVIALLLGTAPRVLLRKSSAGELNMRFVPFS